MGTIKAGFWVLVICIAFIFFFQNYNELQHPVVVSLDFYLKTWTSSPIHLWMLLILFFLLGFIISSLHSAYERLALKRELKVLRAAKPAASEAKQ
ncbi:MAG: lipopolysaccharide assembly protein LapA domain-containing protein [Proteobacteria bacterium]|nr:lipopolysaccharide assembly protein LapA domain-containing protein [Pseudomonadota bacterium]